MPLHYIRSEQPAGGADKYHGTVAAGYDQKREQQPKWVAEQAIVEDMLSDLPEESWILDIPVGTGRFIPFYEKKRFHVRGCDISADMREQARAKVTPNNAARAFVQIPDKRISVTDLPFGGEEFDAAVMVRLTRWLGPEDRDKALRELQRVAKQRIVFTARVANHRYAYPYEDINASLADGWAIHRDEAAAEEAYRVIELRKKS